MSIVIRRPWTRQPQTAVGIDWSNPLTQGLVYATPGAESPSYHGVAKTLPYRSALVRGFGVTYGAGSSDICTTNLTTHSTQRTYFIRYLRNGAGGASLGRLFDKRTGTTQAEVLYFDTGGGIGNKITYARQASTQAGTWYTNSGNSTGIVYSYAVVYDSSSASNDPVIYVDGASVPVLEFQPYIGTPNTNTDSFSVGNRDSDKARVWDGWIGEFFVWDRLLGTPEIASVHANPWQLFAPQTQRIWVPSAAAGVPTLTGIAASSITSGGAVLTIN